MNTIPEWVTWVFSGIGVAILMFILNLFINRDSNSIKQNQKSGSNSTNIQIGGNVKINKKNDK